MFAAGTIPTSNMSTQESKESKKPKHWLRGIEGLVKKADFSRYMHGLTDKQQLAFSLKYEFQVQPSEIASRMGIDRKTAAEHIDLANKKVREARSNERRNANRAKNSPE